MKTVIVVNKQGLGHGDAALGERVLKTFFNKLGRFEGLEAICFFNGGVKLLAKGSDMLQPLSVLAEHGVDVIACGTCVDHYGLREDLAVGEVQSMDRVLDELMRAEKVITL